VAETGKINVQEKRSELLALWSDLFGVARTLVDRVKAGEMTLKASLLHELNAFLKESQLILERLERMHREAEQRRVLEGYARQEDDADGSAEYPFPVTDEPLETG
jgi:hypothetical protein